MVGVPIFGRKIDGWNTLTGSIFSPFWFVYWQVGDNGGEGGKKVEAHGCGEGAFLLGRRTVFRIVLCCCIILFSGSRSWQWRWHLDSINGYSVKGTYHFLTTIDAPLEWGLFDDVWHKQALLKVSIFAWRLLCNRLPTKDNLVRRQILHHEDNMCVTGCGSIETTDHLFFTCDIFTGLWFLVLQWLHFYFVPPLEFVVTYFSLVIWLDYRVMLIRSFDNLVVLCLGYLEGAE